MPHKRTAPSLTGRFIWYNQVRFGVLVLRYIIPIVLRDIYDTAIILSGDQDYVPAVQVVKDSGKRVVNVAFRARNGSPLPGGARRLNQVTDNSLEIEYAKLNSYLNIR